MSTQSQNNKRIAKNSFALALRMIFSTCIALYTSRVILKTLGIEDFGIYNVVGGMVSMTAIFTNSLRDCIQRFLSFELGKNNIDKLKIIFSTSINIMIVIIILTILILETVGIWFLNNKLNIPADRLTAANWVLQFSIITLAVKLISIPYDAIITAYERFRTFAYVGITEAVLKLIVSFSIIYSPCDKLIFYGFFLLIISLIIRVTLGIYAKINFKGIKYIFVLDKKTFKEMLYFGGWQSYNSAARIISDHGGNMLLNIFFNPIVNSARGIASQIYNAIYQFVFSFISAVKPQIIKSYATGDITYMTKLVLESTKFTFFLSTLITLPLFITAPYILNIWLENTPEHTTEFIRLILIYISNETMTYCIITAIMATGNIKKYNIITGSFEILNVPISYALFYFKFSPETIYLVSILISIINLFVKITILSKLIGISIKKFIFEVYLISIITTLAASIVPSIISRTLGGNFICLIIIWLTSIICNIASIYIIGCNKNEKLTIKNNLLKFIQKIKK